MLTLKKKNFILIAILVIFLTGCNATYEIDIHDDEVVESLQFVEQNSSVWDAPISTDPNEGTEATEGTLTYRKMINDELKRNTQVFINESGTYFNKKLISNSKGLGLLYSHTYDILDYKNAYIPNNCFEYFNVITQKDVYIISTGEGFTCFDTFNKLKNLKIIVNTNHKVKDTNADIVEGNSYIWEVDKNSSTTKSIYIELYQDKFVTDYDVIKRIIVIIIALAILSIIVIIFFKKKASKNNKI